MANEEVLIVEDDPGWQRELRIILEEKGYRVRVAGTYSEALAVITNGIVKVAVVDLSLISENKKDRQGLELMKAIRIPVVVVSGVMWSGEGEKLLSDGLVREYFSKKNLNLQVEAFLAQVGESMRRFDLETQALFSIPKVFLLISLCSLFFAISCIVNYILLAEPQFYPAILCYISGGISIELGMAGLLIHWYVRRRIPWRK